MLMLVNREKFPDPRCYSYEPTSIHFQNRIGEVRGGSTTVSMHANYATLIIIETTPQITSFISVMGRNITIPSRKI